MLDAGDNTKKMTIIVTKGTLDWAYPPFILGTTAAAMDVEVTMFFTFYGLQLLKKDLDLKISTLGNPAMQMPMGGMHMSLPNIVSMVPGVDRMATTMMKNLIKKKGVASIECVPGRLERVACESPGAVFVDYAHTPDALENVLRVVRDVTRGRLICVFGCGGDRDKSKRAPMGRAVAALADVGILTSDNPRHEDPQAIINDVLAGFEGSGKCQRIVQIDRRAAIKKAIALAGEDDTVLIAGKGHEDYQIIGDKRFQFDDRQVAIEAALQTTVEAVQKIEVPA